MGLLEVTRKYKWPGTTYKPTAQELNSSSYTIDFRPGGRFYGERFLGNGTWGEGNYTFVSLLENVGTVFHYSMWLDFDSFGKNISVVRINYKTIGSKDEVYGHYHISDSAQETKGAYAMYQDGTRVEAGTFYYYRLTPRRYAPSVFTHLYVPESEYPKALKPIYPTSNTPSSER